MTREHDLTHIKNKWMIICAVILAFLGCILIFLGLFLPPMGEIHPSVLTALGELFTFSGSLWGLNTHYRIKTAQIRADAETKIREHEQHHGDTEERE